MSSNKWTEEEVRALKDGWDVGSPIRVIAEALGKSPKAVERKIAGLGLKKRETGPKAPRDVDAADYWKKEYKRVRDLLEEERFRKTEVEALIDEVVSVAPVSYDPAPPVKWPAPHKGSPQSAVLMLSDQHVGQEVEEEQTLGFGRYDVQTYLGRLKRLEEAIYSIMHDHTTTPIDELVVALLGDTLHGALNHATEAGQRHTLFEQFFIASHSTAQFLRNLSTLVPRVRIYTAVGNHCVDMETEIFTRRGWLRGDQVRAADECLGLTSAGEVVWQSVLSVVLEDRVDRMVALKNRQFDFRGTEHHRFYFRPKGMNKMFEARWSEIADFPHEIEIPVAGCCRKSGVGVPDQLIELCAAVLTDGSISENGDVIVYQKPDKEKWVRDAFEKSGLTFTRRERTREAPKEICGRPWKGGPNTVEVSYRLSSDSAREFLRATGLEKGNIPGWAWEMTGEQFSRFLYHLLLGDGTEIDSTNPVLYGKSKEWLGELQGLCSLHGWKAALSEYHPNNTNPAPQYRLSLCKTCWVTLGCSASREYESAGTEEKVWCVQTQTENFLCRRRGKSYFTGNTRWQNQRKMPTDNRYSNLDQFVYATTQALTRDIPTIEWTLNKQPMALFQVQGFQFAGGHGDVLRGGDKALGIPAHAIGRQVSSMMGLRARAGQPLVNYFLFGHVHKPIQLPHTLGEVITNGGFPGVDGYGLAEGFQSYWPSQKLFFVHPRYGRTASYDLDLTKPVRSETTYNIPTI